MRLIDRMWAGFCLVAGFDGGFGSSFGWLVVGVDLFALLDVGRTRECRLVVGCDVGRTFVVTVVAGFDVGWS